MFSSWLSNLLGNSITLNSIYKKIQDAKAANDTVATYYWYGRLTNILVIFSPLTEDNFEEKTVPTKSKKLLAEILSLLEAQGTSALAAARQRPKKPKPKPKATVL